MSPRRWHGPSGILERFLQGPDLDSGPVLRGESTAQEIPGSGPCSGAWDFTNALRITEAHEGLDDLPLFPWPCMVPPVIRPQPPWASGNSSNMPCSLQPPEICTCPSLCLEGSAQTFTCPPPLYQLDPAFQRRLSSPSNVKGEPLHHPV